jgi:acetyltransferase-like isoleucine patch superfamily enzyme
VESGVTVGDDVVIKNGVSLWEGLSLESGVFVGPQVAFTNDLRPRAKLYKDAYERTVIREGASIGANATILCGIILGRFAMVGAGAVVVHDVPDFGLVMGNPAVQVGFSCVCGARLNFERREFICGCGRAFSRRLDDVVQVG